MKTILKVIYPMLSFALAMVSCNKDPEYYTLETPPDQMHVTASTDNLILEKEKETEDVITFTWNDATERDTDGDLVYYFRLYHAEMNDLQSELIKIPNESLTITWTTRELNNLLNAWKILPGTKATIEAEVLAVVENTSEYLKPELSTTQFDVVGYDSSNKLYIAVESKNQRQSFEMNALGDDIFTWTGELETAEFWFVRNPQSEIPGYFKGETETALVYSNSEILDKFQTDRLGSYNIRVDLTNLTIEVKVTPINRLFLITTKEGVENIISLTEVEPGSDIYYFEDILNEGTEFRFSRYEDATWPAYVTGTDNNSLELKDKEEATMFHVDKTAKYVMTVDMNKASLIFLDVYSPPTSVIAVVGDAVSAGWDAGSAVEYCKLEQHDKVNKPEVISYTGSFTADGNNEDSFKFLGDANWNHGLFATIANADPFTQKDVTDDSAGDRKWKLQSGFKNGTYTLELNLHTMQITLIPQ